LLSEAKYENPRLREVLLLHGLENYPNKNLDSLLEPYKSLNELYTRFKTSLKSSSYKSDVTNPFYKTYNSYKVKRDYHENRAVFKLKLIEKINELKLKKNISNYQVYNKFKLNPGNINFVLKHKDPNKISETILKDIYSFVQTI
jgi:hypothetical protein